jgi:hypothetical protein
MVKSPQLDELINELQELMKNLGAIVSKAQGKRNI